MLLSDTQLGLLQGPSFVLMFALVSIPLGRLADVASRRLIILMGLLVWTSATIACGLATNFPQLIAARMFVGVGEAALVPAALSLIVSYFPARLVNRGVSAISAGGPLGQAIALLGGGLLLSAFRTRGSVQLPIFGSTGPWQAIFVIFGSLGFVLAALSLTIVEPARPTPDEGVQSTLRGALAHFGAQKAAFVPIFIAFSMIGLCLQALSAWSPSFLTRERGMDVGAAGAALGLCSLVVGLAGNVAGGWLADRMSARGVKAPQLVLLAAGLVFALPCGLAFWLAPNAALSLLSYAFLYGGLILAGAAGYGGTQAISPPQHSGMMTSLFLCSSILIGAGIGPVFIGVLSDLGLPSLGGSIFAVIVVGSIVGAPLAWWGRSAFEAARNDPIAPVQSPLADLGVADPVGP